MGPAEEVTESTRGLNAADLALGLACYLFRFVSWPRGRREDPVDRPMHSGGRGARAGQVGRYLARIGAELVAHEDECVRRISVADELVQVVSEGLQILPGVVWHRQLCQLAVEG